MDYMDYMDSMDIALVHIVHIVHFVHFIGGLFESHAFTKLLGTNLWMYLSVSST